MRPFAVTLALSALLAGSSALHADAIPYPNIGTIAPTVPLVATSTGVVTGYFYSSTATDLDVIYFADLTSGYLSGPMFPNQTTPVGTAAVFGPVTAGDVLGFAIYNEYTGQTFASIPSYSSDGVNHAYVTSFSGGAGIPAGLYVGMEDLPNGGSDFNYNDDDFVFTNVTAVPEPGSLTLLGTGILGVAGMLRRRMFSR